MTTSKSVAGEMKVQRGKSDSDPRAAVCECAFHTKRRAYPHRE